MSPLPLRLYVCGICRSDAPAIQWCDSCELDICDPCYVPADSRCQRCADNLRLSEDDVLAAVHAHPRMTLDEIVTRLRAAAMASDIPGVPVPSWWVLRTRDLVRDMLRSGYLRCAFSLCILARRDADELGRLCEIELADKGREMFR